MILKRIYQEVIVDHKSREVKFCGWLYGSREKVKTRIDRRVEHLSRGVTLRDEIEDFGGGTEIVMPKTLEYFPVEIYKQTEKDGKPLWDYCVVWHDVIL